MPCLSSLVWLCLATPAKPSERKRGQCAHSLNGYFLSLSFNLLAITITGIER